MIIHWNAVLLFIVCYFVAQLWDKYKKWKDKNYPEIDCDGYDKDDLPF